MFIAFQTGATEMGQDDVKNIRKAAVLDAVYTVSNGNRSELARRVGVKVDDMHNWSNRGSKLLHWVAIKIHELSQVSLDRLAPLELLSNDLYYKDNPFVKVFEHAISAIKIPSFFKMPKQTKEQDHTRPIILDLKNVLIFGQETLAMAQRAGHQALRVIRLDAHALLKCQRNILNHPNQWLSHELQAIASYLEAYAKHCFLGNVGVSQDLRNLICQRLGLKDDRIFGVSKSTLFKPKAESRETNNQEVSSNHPHKFKI